MSLGGGPIKRDNTGDFVGRYGHVGVEKSTMLYGTPKRSSSEKLGIAFQRWIKKTFSPKTYLAEREKYLKMFRGESGDKPADIAKALKDRKVAVYVGELGVVELQKNLKKAEADARKAHGLPEDEEGAVEDEFSRLREARLGQGKADIAEKPWNMSETDYVAQQQKLRDKFVERKKAKKQIDQSSSELYSKEFGSAEKELTELKSKVENSRRELFAWTSRRKAVPWYSKMEKEIPADFVLISDGSQKRMSKADIDTKLEELESAHHKAFYDLKLKQDELKWVPDQKRYPNDVMARVNEMLDQAKNDIDEKNAMFAQLEEQYGTDTVLKEGAGKMAFAKDTQAVISDFRKKTVTDAQALAGKTPDETKVKELYARRIAGQALDRMARMSVDRDKLHIHMDLYKKGQYTAEELQEVEDAERAREGRFSGGNSEKVLPTFYSDSSFQARGSEADDFVEPKLSNNLFNHQARAGTRDMLKPSSSSSNDLLQLDLNELSLSDPSIPAISQENSLLSTPNLMDGSLLSLDASKTQPVMEPLIPAPLSSDFQAISDLDSQQQRSDDQKTDDN